MVVDMMDNFEDKVTHIPTTSSSTRKCFNLYSKNMNNLSYIRYQGGSNLNAHSGSFLNAC